MPQKYAALIIDLKKSRAYSPADRNSIQRFILDIIDALNVLYRGNMLREVDFSAGDEIQGLFKTPEAAYLYYRMFSMWLHPIRMRAGIGVGTWDVQLEGKGTTGQDGRAYHNARHAIEQAEDIEGYPILFYSESAGDILINTVIGAAASIMSRQSAAQNQIMLMTELLFPICTEPPGDGAELFSLLRRKSGFDHEAEGIAKPLPLDRLIPGSIGEICPIHAGEAYEENRFYITGGRQRGIPTRLAGILDISRQSVEKTLKSGSIFAARNMAIAAIHEMQNI